jgi:hypothetical protein
MDYTSLLSGSTGSLGFGGGVGGGGGGYGAASSASSGPISVGPINPSVGNISSGGVNLTPTINIAFPDAELSSGDDINPPLTVFGAKNYMLLGLVAVAVVGFFVLLRK